MVAASGSERRDSIEHKPKELHSRQKILNSARRCAERWC
ncbi:hypothetical protein U91I_00703 [alpha proteobacterium U9-1i]|nr:hypothetical protein U91I_00703 [alpha proteobacterium U9-1i]